MFSLCSLLMQLCPINHHGRHGQIRGSQGLGGHQGQEWFRLPRLWRPPRPELNFLLFDLPPAGTWSIDFQLFLTLSQVPPVIWRAVNWRSNIDPVHTHEGVIILTSLMRVSGDTLCSHLSRCLPQAPTPSARLFTKHLQLAIQSYRQFWALSTNWSPTKMMGDKKQNFRSSKLQNFWS